MKHIRENAEQFKTLSGKRLCAVVKANAYGHGAEEVTLALSGVADCFAVSLLSEALDLRVAACGKDILILTPPMSEAETLCAAQNGFILTVPDLLCARLVVNVSEKYAVQVRVHLKTNTGMNRYGMNVAMLGRVCGYLSDRRRILVEGIYSHLYGDTRESAETQRKLFVQMHAVCRRYFPKTIAHLSATFGSMLGDAFAFDMIRVGIGLYGYLPDGTKKLSDLPQLALQKGMTVYAQVTSERRYSFGGAGYGEPKLTIEKGERLSVVRYGYADGFLRNRKNGANGYEHCVNHLCMDACVRAEKVKRGRLLPVLTDADETAEIADTISYEVLCSATRRAEMVYDYD